jgi:hypothetical protein
MTADDPNDISDESLDGLVEGTLDDDRRRALLLALEADPEGWRRCALAFLEAQAWTQALAPLADHAASTLSIVAATGNVRAVSHRSTRAKWKSTREKGDWLRSKAKVPVPLFPGLPLKTGLAAGLLALAFGAGLLANRPSPLDRPVRVASDPSPASSFPAAPEEPAPATDEIASNPPIDDFSGGMDAIPGHVRRQLASQGYKVEQRRMLVDLPLEDGRFVAVPVDQVSFEYVGNQAL